MTKPIEASYDRPTKAVLIVRLGNGEEWAATQEDMDRFELINRHDAYWDLYQALKRVGLDDSRHASLRYYIERTLSYGPDVGLAFKDDNEEDAETMRRVRALLADIGTDDEGTIDESPWGATGVVMGLRDDGKSILVHLPNHQIAVSTFNERVNGKKVYVREIEEHGREEPF